MSLSERKTRLSDGKPPSLAERYLERALDSYANKKYQSALGDLDEAIRLERQNAELYATRGFILMILEEDREAERDLARALKIDPSQWIAHYARALRAFRTGDYPATITHLSYAQRYAPLRPEIYLYQAATYYYTRNKKLAEQAIDSAMQVIQPDDKHQKQARKWKSLIKKMS
jgi:Flp pilus assembly protein TadD